MFFVLKRNKLIVIIIALVMIAISVSIFSVYAIETDALAKRLVPIYSVETTENKVALTFDCAWGADKTRSIMDAIENAGYKCTFFVTGFWVDANGELVKEIVSRGHQIGNHSDNHPHMGKASDQTVRSEIDNVNSKIEALVGEKPSCFRAPFGEYDNKLLNTLSTRNMLCIQWSIDSLDWKGITGSEIAKRVINRLKSGDIVLFHNNSDHILDALPLVLSAIKNKGLNAVRVDELVYFANYVINAEGKQIKNS